MRYAAGRHERFLGGGGAGEPDTHGAAVQPPAARNLQPPPSLAVQLPPTLKRVSRQRTRPSKARARAGGVLLRPGGGVSSERIRVGPGG